jgi:DNA-binding transcriptional LysR family regulator
MLQDAKWFQPVLDASSVCMETNSTDALVVAATAGLGIAVLPRFVTRRHEELASVSKDTAAHEVWLITHPEFRRDPKVRAMVEFLKTIAAALDEA